MANSDFNPECVEVLIENLDVTERMARNLADDIASNTNMDTAEGMARHIADVIEQLARAFAVFYLRNRRFDYQQPIDGDETPEEEVK